MKLYNVASRSDPKDRLIDYNAFVRGLRQPLTGRRLEWVENLWKHIGGTDTCKVGQMKAKWARGDEVFAQCAMFMGFDSANDDACYSHQDWLDCHADVSTVVFSDEDFIKMGSEAWGI